jgi:hypothetical protein
MNPIPQPLFSAMPDALVTGPAAGTYYTLTPRVVRKISQPRGIYESDTFAVLATVMIGLREGGDEALASISHHGSGWTQVEKNGE